MTQTSERPGPTGPSADLEDDLATLRDVLATHPFPAQQDDLLAALIARHEPVRLAWRLSTLSRTRTYLSLDDLCADLRAGALDVT